MIDEIIKLNNIGKVKENVSYELLTTYKLIGTARIVVTPSNEEELKNIMRFLKEHQLKYKVIGAGSNIVFVNDYYDGVIISMRDFTEIEFNDTYVTVGAGYNLSSLALECAKRGLSGLEFAVGIPALIGGAVFMNAGAYKMEIKNIINKVWYLDETNEVKILYNKDLDYTYRMSIFKKNRNLIILKAQLILINKDAKELVEIIEERRQRRAMSQPLDYPSAGSVFINQENINAWEVVEKLGFRGKSVGGATVSDKHTNFIINTGKAKGSDVVGLIEQIKEKARQDLKIELETEQEFIE